MILNKLKEKEIKVENIKEIKYNIKETGNVEKGRYKKELIDIM
jgi:hypothetical protein